MIYTVTVNPSLDYVVSVNDFRLGVTNRTKEEQMLPGGKGINVSTVFKNLGYDSVALGFVAGFTGDALINKLNEIGVKQDFIKILKGNTRINIKLKSIDGTEINGMGPNIDNQDIEKLMNKLDEVAEGDVVVLAGSIPGSVSKDLYRDILMRLKGRGVLTVVDATGELLTNVLPYQPFLIKPNNHELGDIFGVELKTKDDVIPYGRKLQQMGARNVLISMAAEGAVLVAEDGSVIKEDAPKGEVVNAVGAGDSMVAGFMAGWIEKKDYTHAFRMGVSAGSASAFSELLATKEEIMKVYNNTFNSLF